MTGYREPERGDLVAYRHGPNRGMPFGVCRGDVAGPSGKRLVEVALLRSGRETDVIEADELTAVSEWRVMLREQRRSDRHQQ
jgi:hypothetical protein